MCVLGGGGRVWIASNCSHNVCVCGGIAFSSLYSIIGGGGGGVHNFIDHIHVQHTCGDKESITRWSCSHAGRGIDETGVP